MMGYSVTEAASVLGVPTERVWELLARGVLSGEKEGETGMRVFLQPRPAPAPVVPAEEQITARSNGPERELSPFRELLTEFRSLTERYGQALLALGEARGEVASLRSRVDLLEARVDLRLPTGPPAAAPWPTQPLPVSEPSGASGARPEVAGEHDDEDVHRPRRRGARRAIEGFAQALARAEDPSLADLPGRTEADALAAFRSEAEATEADRILPREGPPAEPVLVADETATTEASESAAVEDEVVDAWAEPVDALAAPADIGPEPVDVEAESVDATVTPEPREDALIAALPVADPEPWPEFEAATEPAIEAEPEPAAVEPEAIEPSIVELPADEVGQSTAAAVIEAEAEPAEAEPAEAEPAEPEPVEPEPADFDAERYTTAIEQPDWFEAEADDAWPTAAPGDETIADIHESTPADQGDALDPAAARSSSGEPAPEEPFEKELASRGGESGANEMEVAAGGPGASDQPDDEQEREELPGARELDEALGAFGPLGAGAPGDLPLPPDDDEWPPASVGGAEPYGPSALADTSSAGPLPSSPGASPLGGRPATRAYRRLRRIFPT